MKKLILLILILIILTSCDLSLNKENSKVVLVSVALNYKDMSISDLNATLNDQSAINRQIEHLCKESDKTFLGYSIKQDGSNVLSSTSFKYPSKINTFSTVKKISIHLIKNEILSIFNDIKKKTNPQDLIIFYYSGHGDGMITDEKYTSLNGSLILGPISFGNPKLDSWYDFSSNLQLVMTSYELRSELLKIKGNKLVLLDSCYSGNHIKNDQGLCSYNEVDKAFDNLFSLNSSYSNNIWELTSSAIHEKSYEDNDSNIDSHGYFTKELLKVLGYEFYDGTYEGVGLPNKRFMCLSDIYATIYDELKKVDQSVQYGMTMKDLVLFNL